MKAHRRWLPLALPVIVVLSILTIGIIYTQAGSNAQGDEETQACCLPDGTCKDLLVGECLDNGGIPQGEGTSCITMVSPCLQPTQACCFDDGTCREVDPEECIAEGGTPQGEGTDCSLNRCGGGSEGRERPHPSPTSSVLATIELISPASGASFDPRFPDLSFCWKGIGNRTITYEVIHEAGICDPSVLAGPHPFAPLIPDPSLGERKRELKWARREREFALADFSRYCDHISTVFATLRQLRGSLIEARGELLEEKEAAEYAEAGDFSLHLPDSCPVGLSSLLSPYPASFDDLSPCGDCRAFADRLTGIIGRFQSLDAHRFCRMDYFYRLADRWIGGAEHRGSMEVYHALFSAIDAVIGLASDLLDHLTPDIESVLEQTIDRYMTEEVCRRYPAECEAIRTAQDIKGQLDTIKGIMEEAKMSGTPGPAFMVQMVQAMAQAASAATAVAVEGWENYAAVMQAALSEAYETLLCEEEAIDWLLEQEEAINGLCKACQDCIAAEISEIDDQIAEIERSEDRSAQERAAYWQEQRSLIAGQIQAALALLGDDWYEECCRAGAGRIEVPGDSPCSERLEEALKETLGDKACFLTFVFTCDGDGLVSFEFSFPLAERRPGCCVPSRTQRTSLGSRSDPGERGGTVCHPENEAEAARLTERLEDLPNGEWLVEGRDAAGDLVAASERRRLWRGGVTLPSELPQGQVPPPACGCSISASLNGAPVPAAGATISIQAGTAVNIAVGGDCGPACDNGRESIAIQPPMIHVMSGSSSFLVPALPLRIQGANTTYDFPDPGTYAITVSRTCEDGTGCSYAFDVVAQSPPPSSPVSRLPRDGEGCCPSCGTDECLELSYSRSGDGQIIPILGQRLAVAESAGLTLHLTSDCRPDGAEGRTVRWEFTKPDGGQDLFEGVDLYRIDYTFNRPGEYLLCVIETIPTTEVPEGRLYFENWWIFEVSSSD